MNRVALGFVGFVVVFAHDLRCVLERSRPFRAQSVKFLSSCLARHSGQLHTTPSPECSVGSQTGSSPRQPICMGVSLESARMDPVLEHSAGKMKTTLPLVLDPESVVLEQGTTSEFHY